jgi:hypothetical protein
VGDTLVLLNGGGAVQIGKLSDDGFTSPRGGIVGMAGLHKMPGFPARQSAGTINPKENDAARKRQLGLVHVMLFRISNNRASSLESPATD